MRHQHEWLKNPKLTMLVYKFLMYVSISFKLQSKQRLLIWLPQLFWYLWISSIKQFDKYFGTFTHLVSALRCDFLKLTLVEQNQGKLWKIAMQCGKRMRKPDVLPQLYVQQTLEIINTNLGVFKHLQGIISGTVLYVLSVQNLGKVT